MKHPKYMCIIGLLVAQLSVVFGQEVVDKGNSKHITHLKELSFAYGPMYSLKIDKTYSRLPKKGFNHSFALRYDNVKNNRMVNIQTYFATGLLKTQIGDENELKNYAVLISLRYLKKINKLQVKDLSLYAGLSIGLRGEIWFPETLLLTYGWDVNSGLGGAISAHYTINSKLSVQYDFDLHFIGVLWRSHNNGQQLTTEELQLEKGLLATAFETPRFSHPFNSFYVDNNIKLIYVTSEKVTVFYNFIFTYRYLKLPLVKKGYDFNNTLGITYKF